MLKILLLSLLCFLLVSCVGVKNEYMISNGSLSSLTKGVSPIVAQAKVEAKPALVYKSKKVPGYSVQKFVISNGIQVDPYYLTYKNNRLEYWGYAHEHKRILGSLNRVIDEVLTMEEQLKKAKKSKKLKKKLGSE